MSRQQVGNFAAEEFESGVGFDSASAMLGDEHGPQAYLNQAGLGQILAQYGTDTLAANQANAAVAKVFRIQAHDLLEAQQFMVCEAGTGMEALAALDEHDDIALVITDHHMPDMDGYELTRRIRQP